MGDDSSSGSRLCVSVVDAHGRSVRTDRLAGWLARAAPRGARGDVTIALVSDWHIRRLNREYRGVDRATDVLSFPSVDDRPSAVGGRRSAVGTARHLGDIVIGRGVADRQARRARHSALTEQRILALHGLLHLLGYDHETDRGRMARVEARLRRRSGLPSGLIEREQRA
jgi:probable rRNA maturation factor